MTVCVFVVWVQFWLIFSMLLMLYGYFNPQPRSMNYSKLHAPEPQSEPNRAATHDIIVEIKQVRYFLSL